LVKEYYKTFKFQETKSQDFYQIAKTVSFEILPFHQILVNFQKYNVNSLFFKVPKQDNFSDCGLYLLSYVEMFLANPSDIIKKNKVL